MPVGGRHIAGAWVSLTLLRRVHACRLPVEVWYLGDRDLPPAVRELLTEFNVRFVDATQGDPSLPPDVSGWVLKPFALLHSGFAEVLGLDADNVPLADPAPLFEQSAYRLTGAAFWPDIRPANPYNPIWSLCGLSPSAGPEWESGQLLIDRTRAYAALALAMHFNAEADFYYRYILGDKETFHLAWRILGAPFAMPGTPPEPATGRFDSDATPDPATIALWQHDFDGRRLFLHRTGAKWTAFGRHQRIAGFALEDVCLDALAELRERWDGYLAPSPLPVPLVPTAEGVSEHRAFAYVRRGFEARPLELLPGGRVGAGARRAERYWRLEDTADGATLVLSSREEDTCRLDFEPDGVWRGRWLRFEQDPVELIPTGDTGRPVGEDTGARPRLLFVSPVMPVDGGNGLAMRAAAVLRALTRAYRVSLLVVPLYAPGPAVRLPDWVPERCDAVRWAPPPRPLRPEERLGHDPLFLTAWIEAAGRAFPDERFDVVHVFRRATIPFAERYQSRARGAAADWHLDLDDVESRSLARLAGLYARHARAVEQADAQRRAVEAEAVEKHVRHTWDRVYVCSTDDRAFLVERPGSRRVEVRVLPNVVDLPPDPGPARRGSPLEILFVGSFGHFPNVDAAGWFCREILPVLREQTSAPLRLLLAGSGAPPEVRELGHIPEVECVGAVPEIAEWYRRADLVVVPLRAGGGTRIKVLEALAHRRPVVSTTVGAEGLRLADGEHLLLADRAHHFAEQCLSLLGDAEQAGRLADRGRAYVARHYHPNALAEPLSRSR